MHPLRRPLVATAAVVFACAGVAGAAEVKPLDQSDTKAAPTGLSEPAVPRRANILIVITDDQRQGLNVMPAVRKYFTEQGRTYPSAFVTTPVCCPSRASIMTGQYAHNHHVQSNIPGVTLDEFVQRDTIQKRLHSDGYTTAYYGKFLNGWALTKDPNYFDTYALADVGDNSSDTRYYNTPFAVRNEGEVGQHEEIAEGYVTDYLGDEAVDFIDSHRNTPWLMILAPTAPHSPYTPESIYRDAWVGQWPGNEGVWEEDRSDKPPYVQAQDAQLSKGQYIRARQLRTLMSVDDVVERIFSTLRRIGESQDTLALYISDNGYMWGEHGLIAKDVPYTPAVKVRMLARWPAAIPAGSVDRRLVSNIDIAPTALAAAGLDPTGMDGRNLLDVSWARRRILLEHWCNVRACNLWAATRTKGHQYVEYYNADGRTTFREFYDLRRDPWQLRNLLYDGDSVNDPDWRPLAEQLAADRSCAGVSCP